jgi:hypothetical protein
VFCRVQGRVEIVGMTDAPICWPIGQRGRAKALVVYKDLVRAVRRESELAVAHWWGITAQTVWKWRRALSVDPTTKGTSRLRHDYALEPPITAAREKAQAKATDSDRRAKIAAARRGKPRPAHVIEAMCRGRLGKPHSEEARRKMSAAQRARGTRPPKAGRPWTAEEDEAVRTLPAAEAAQRTGRSLSAVYSRRSDLQLPDGRRSPSGARPGQKETNR